MMQDRSRIEAAISDMYRSANEIYERLKRARRCVTYVTVLDMQ